MTDLAVASSWRARPTSLFGRFAVARLRFDPAVKLHQLVDFRAVATTLRLDPDVLEYFRKQGLG
jgi:hypothetical protein